MNKENIGHRIKSFPKNLDLENFNFQAPINRLISHYTFPQTQLHHFSLLTIDNKTTEERSEDLTQRVVISNDKKSEEYAIIAPNGAPILASSVPGTFFS